jgi:hypothetical protein
MTGTKTISTYDGIPLDPKQVFAGDVCELAQQPSTTKGRNVSGRGWKVRPQKRASHLIKTVVNNQTKTWEARQADKLNRQEALALQKEMGEQKRQACIDKRERREENERRRAENEFQSSNKGVQTLNAGKLSSTLKSMSKKQLRQIKKTRVNNKTGAVEFVSAYAK